ncbi:hypothetical protein FQA39_LY06900 [Lamprigera yunnana]|nr:hypothetical protein FQA39_LY06900 [Lamprigera yunnana]
MKEDLVVFLGVLLCMAISAEFVWPSPDEEKCIKELSLDKKHIESFIVKYVPGELPDNDADFIKFAVCLAKQIGAQDENGQFNFPNLIEFIQYFDKSIYSNLTGNVGEEIATKAVDSCKTIDNKEDSGKSLIKMQNCLDSYLADYFDTDS